MLPTQLTEESKHNRQIGNWQSAIILLTGESVGAKNLSPDQRIVSGERQ
jgi:hypothetical protein